MDAEDDLLLEPFRPRRSVVVDEKQLLEPFRPKKHQFVVAMRGQSRDTLAATRKSTIQQIEDSQQTAMMSDNDDSTTDASSTEFTSNSCDIYSASCSITDSISSSSALHNNSITIHPQRVCEGAIQEIDNYYDKLYVCVNDDDAFRKLKEDMREQCRTGFASRQVIYDLIRKKSKRRLMAITNTIICGESLSSSPPNNNLRRSGLQQFWHKVDNCKRSLLSRKE